MYKRFRNGSLRVCAAMLLALTVHGLAMAGAALTLELADNATRYMEWLLEVSFTADQRQQYQQILAQTWRGKNQGAIDGVTAMARAQEKLASMSDSERAAIREKLQGEFVRMLRAASDNDSRWLLGLYESAHKGQMPATVTPVSAVSTPAAAQGGGPLVGRWTNGRVSMIQYQNAYTGAPAPTNGSTFAYEFHADGTYSFTGLLQSVMYQCTTAIFSNETGTYSVAGNAVSLRPEKNPYKMTNNCAPSSNKEGPGKLINRTFQFRVTPDGPNTMLEFTGSDGGVQKFTRSR